MSPLTEQLVRLLFATLVSLLLSSIFGIYSLVHLSQACSSEYGHACSPATQGRRRTACTLLVHAGHFHITSRVPFPEPYFPSLFLVLGSKVGRLRYFRRRSYRLISLEPRVKFSSSAQAIGLSTHPVHSRMKASRAPTTAMQEWRLHSAAAITAHGIMYSVPSLTSTTKSNKNLKLLNCNSPE